MKDLRILFVSLAVPYPPSNGHRLRNWALLQALAENGNEVTMASFAEPQELSGDARPLREVCHDVQLVPLPRTVVNGGAEYRSRLRAFVSALPYGTWRFRSQEMRARIGNLLRAEKFDLIICDDIYQVQNLPEPSPVPVLLNKHDITHVIVRRYLAHEANPAKLAYGWAEYWKLRQWEVRACSQLTGILACSEADRALLEALCPGARIAVLPNVIDVASYLPAGKDDSRTVLYAGAMDWLPNQDAVAFFVSEILPRLRELIPDVRFRVAGRNPSPSLLRRFGGTPGVEFTGHVPDIRAEIARAAVCVVPLRIGSGTRLKILEAGAMARAVVSTSIGAEGLDLADGTEILLADRPHEFAAAVATLLRDPERRHRMGQAARRRVETRYSLSALRAATRHALVEFAGVHHEAWSQHGRHVARGKATA